MKIIKKVYLLFFLPLVVNATCNNSDWKHKNKRIPRCTYFQEDIYRTYSNKPGCYMTEKTKECFFCGCPISHHTTQDTAVQSVRKR